MSVRIGRASADNAHAAAQRMVRGLAGVCAALMLVVITASAYLRLAHGSALCGASWLCGDGASAANAAALARGAHRMAASAVPLLLLALLLAARAQRPRPIAQARMAAAGIVIAIGLALLGVRMSAATPATAPWIALANLAGGFALLALAAAAWSNADAALLVARGHVVGACRRSTGMLMRLASLALAIAIVLGSLASASMGTAQVAHRVLGVLTVALVLTAAWHMNAERSGPRSRRAAVVVVVLALGGGLSGIGQAWVAPSLPVILLHNLCAALLLAVLVGALAWRPGGGARAERTARAAMPPA